MAIKFYIETKKTKDEKGTWTGLYADYGYGTGIVSMETDVIAQIADCKISQVKSIPVGQKYWVGELKPIKGE